MISLINHGSGNIAASIAMMPLSNFEFEVIDRAEQIRSARRLPLPSAGASDDTMQAFKPGVRCGTLWPVK
jgi:imidazoleglycerol phosphate synthase glutamine amidotransferase subunit HisH